MAAERDATAEIVTLTPMRRAIGRRMTESKQQAPHFYISSQISVDPLMAALERMNDGRDKADRVTVTAALVQVLARTLVDHPRLNARWTDAGLVLLPSVNIGIAVALDDGLIAPALLDCAGLEIDEIGPRLRDLAARARAGRLRAAELSEATFTLSNLGMFAVDSFQAIIVPPQVAILATAAVRAMPAVRDGSLVEIRTLTASLSADHRALDGADAARFLTALKERVESFA